MLIKRIEKETRRLAPPSGTPESEVVSLSIRDVETPTGNFMVSAWEPTIDELNALMKGETIKLWICGSRHPVVGMTVGELKEPE